MAEDEAREFKVFGEGSLRTVAMEKKRAGGVVVTQRDLEVLRYVLEMKFASSDELFFRFFETRPSGEKATSQEFMRRRLIELEEVGLLKRERLDFYAGVHFLATKTARHLLQQAFPSQYFLKPISKVNGVHFLHDSMVARCRREFELSLGITEWISDHSLKSLSPKLFGLESRFSPDGVYRLPSGERVAFELEIARKRTVLYEEKIFRFVKAIREGRDNTNMFTQVHFRCVDPWVAKCLKKMTSMYGPIFEVSEGHS